MITREADNDGEESLISTIEYPEASGTEPVIQPLYILLLWWTLEPSPTIGPCTKSLFVIKSLKSIDWLVVVVLH